MTADFRALFTADARSRSVYMPTRDADWAKRILVGPNIVFEASRTALDDAPVAGPAGAPATAPDQKDALGAPIDIALSSRLLAYFATKGSTVLAPAVTRRWSPEWWCPKESCRTTTWVERVLLAHQARSGAGKDAPRFDVRADELPTAMFAVRRLGRVPLSSEVVAEEGGNTLVYRFRRSPAEVSVCPPVSFDVPVLVFEAELVSVRDGRILARIEEFRQIVVPAQAQAVIEAFVPIENEEAVKALRQYAEAASHGQWANAPSMPYWLRSDVRCKNGEEAFRAVARQVAAQADAEQEAAAAQMFAKVLDPMFEAPLADTGKGTTARPKGAASKPR